MSLRPVKRMIVAKPTLEGAGVHLRRAFGFGNTHEFDPFLLLDDFRNDVPEDYLAGFPWHPHRGIETITYVLAGTVEHGDSMGNHGAIAPGDVQWMTAGSGIIHQEMPKGDAARPHARLPALGQPARLPQNDAPRATRRSRLAEIPEVTDDDGTQVRIVCGSFWGQQGPGRGRRRRSHLPRRLRPARPPQDPAGRDHPPRLRLRLRRQRPASATPPARLAVPTEPVGWADTAPPTEADNRSLVLFDRGDELMVAGRRGGHPLPAGLGPAARRAGGLVRPHRHEHPAAAPPGLRRAGSRHLSQAPAPLSAAQFARRPGHQLLLLGGFRPRACLPHPPLRLRQRQPQRQQHRLGHRPRSPPPVAGVAPLCLPAKSARKTAKFRRGRRASGASAPPGKRIRRGLCEAQRRLGAAGPPSRREHKRDARRSRAGARANH